MKIYVLFEVHYINNQRYLLEVNSSDNLDYLINLKQFLSDKYVSSIYRIYESVL